MIPVSRLMEGSTVMVLLIKIWSRLVWRRWINGRPRARGMMPDRTQWGKSKRWIVLAMA